MTLEETIGGGRMSGMDELLDEAIAKAKEVGDSQLVEWLRMARGSQSAARWYTAKLRDLEDENSKLREQVTQLRDDWESERDYANQMEAKEERAVAENAKLRELAEKAWKAAEMLCQAWDGPCHADGVSIKPPCALDERDELCVYGLIQCELRELGIEVK